MRVKSPLVPQLVRDCHEGSISLVIGAGISMSAGVPSWPALVARVWKRAFEKRLPPSWLIGLEEGAGGATEAVAKHSVEGVARHPLALQIMLEEIEGALQPTSRSDPDPERLARDRLASAIRSELYAGLDPTVKSGSLEAIVAAIREDQKRVERRIARVISFNADDLVEELANFGHGSHSDPVVWPVSRASYHPRRGKCANDRSPISVYHVHGYLPRESAAARDAPDTLVFTEMQYWDSVASPSSFANRVVGNALHDSHCVFIGLSMHDINLMRWLGNHASEVRRDKRSDFSARNKTPRQARAAADRALRRHYWIRTEGCDPGGLLKRHLYRRGIYSVSISDWGDSFTTLIEQCFSAGYTEIQKTSEELS